MITELQASILSFVDGIKMLEILRKTNLIDKLGINIKMVKFDFNGTEISNECGNNSHILLL